VFKAHAHPIVDWHGPTTEGAVWHEWETNDRDFAVISAYERAEEFGLVFVQGIRYRATVTHETYGLGLEFTATNTASVPFHNVVGVVCLGSPSDQFRDDALVRTFAVLPDGLTALADTDRGTGDPCRARYPVRSQPPIRFHGEPFWGKVSATILAEGTILRTASDGRYTVAMAWDQASEIWDNQDSHGCIHSNFALDDLSPGATRSVRGKLVLVPGNAEEALAVSIQSGVAATLCPRTP